MKTKIILISTYLLLLTLQTHAQTFTEVSQSLGIEVLHEGKQHLGGGAAFFDFDQDGWLDIYATTGSNGVDRLYHNLGKSETSGEVRFEEVGIVAGLGITKQFRTMGVITGDLNQDGFTDLFISTWEDEATLHSRQTNLKGSRNLCFLNQGDGTFKEVGEQIGFTQATFTMAASFGDYNLDGQLDLYLGNYLHTPKWTAKEGFQNTGHPNLLYLNQGTGSNGLPIFVEVAAAMGLDNKDIARGQSPFSQSRHYVRHNRRTRRGENGAIDQGSLISGTAFIPVCQDCSRTFIKRKVSNQIGVLRMGAGQFLVHPIFDVSLPQIQIQML